PRPNPTVGKPRTRATNNPRPAIANGQCPPMPRGNRAIAATARTTRRRTPRLLSARLPPLAIDPRARPLERSQTVQPSWAVLLSHILHSGRELRRASAGEDSEYCWQVSSEV